MYSIAEMIVIMKIIQREKIALRYEAYVGIIWIIAKMQIFS